jgi:hypothetical protein
LVLEISRYLVAEWLEDYEKLGTEVSAVDYKKGGGGGSGDAGYGVRSSTLAKIMLDQAIEKLPGSLREPVRLRWLVRERRSDILKQLGTLKWIYYSRCDFAVAVLTELVNGRQPEDLRKFMEEIYLGG